MSVSFITGNVLDFPEGTNVLLHIVSLRGAFGAGVAAQIAEEYPAAKEVYMEAFNAGKLRLGEFTSAIVAGGNKRICNLCAMEDIGTERRRIDYEALYVGLSVFRDVLEDAAKQGRIYSVAMPWIGCGLAGGSHRVVRAMIEDVFEASPVKAVVVDYVKKGGAV